jgi:hypothetical protein
LAGSQELRQLRGARRITCLGRCAQACLDALIIELGFGAVRPGSLHVVHFGVDHARDARGSRLGQTLHQLGDRRFRISAALLSDGRTPVLNVHERDVRLVVALGRAAAERRDRLVSVAIAQVGNHRARNLQPAQPAIGRHALNLLVELALVGRLDRQLRRRRFLLLFGGGLRLGSFDRMRHACRQPQDG